MRCYFFVVVVVVAFCFGLFFYRGVHRFPFSLSSVRTKTKHLSAIFNFAPMLNCWEQKKKKYQVHSVKRGEMILILSTSSSAGWKNRG